MRTLIIAMGLAAISATPAFAQNAGIRPAGSAPAAGPVTPPNSSSTSGTTATGTTTSSTSGTSTTTATGTPSISAEANLTAGANTATTGTNTSGTTTATGAGNAFGTNVQTDPSATSVTNSTPAFGPGGAFDTSAAGTTAPLVPEGTVSVIGGGTTGAGMATPAAPQQQQVTIAGQTQTPLFDQAAREGRAKEARRRARGDEPRIYGIAPNTDRDLTWQMPDDRIIRY